MKRLLVISILILSSPTFAQSYKMGQGFQYKTKQQAKEEEQKNKGPQVRVLRFYNQESKVSDPLSEVESNSDDDGLQFFKVTDATLENTAERTVSSVSGIDITDYEVLENVIRDLEKEMGIRSMPVVKFHKDNANVDGLIHRIRYMEYRLGILKEAEAQNLVLTDRIQSIKEKIESR